MKVTTMLMEKLPRRTAIFGRYYFIENILPDPTTKIIGVRSDRVAWEYIVLLISANAKRLVMVPKCYANKIRA